MDGQVYRVAGHVLISQCSEFCQYCVCLAGYDVYSVDDRFAFGLWHPECGRVPPTPVMYVYVCHGVVSLPLRTKGTLLISMLALFSV